MTKAQARRLILLLAAKGIAFKLRRENSAYILAFASGYTEVIKRALGD